MHQHLIMLDIFIDTVAGKGFKIINNAFWAVPLKCKWFRVDWHFTEILSYLGITNIELQQQHMEFPFHNSYVVLEILHKTMLFLAELRCWTLIRTILGCFHDEAIATNIIPSSSQTGWPLRNIHFANGNESFPFYLFFVCFQRHQGRHLSHLTTSNTTGVL